MKITKIKSKYPLSYGLLKEYMKENNISKEQVTNMVLITFLKSKDIKIFKYTGEAFKKMINKGFKILESEHKTDKNSAILGLMGLAALAFTMVMAGKDSNNKQNKKKNEKNN